MRKTSGSIDGLVPRSERRTINSRGSAYKQNIGTPGHRTDLKDTPDTSTIGTEPIRNSRNISRKDIDDSLRGIDDEPAKKARRRGLFGKKQPQPMSRGKRIKKRILKIVLLLLLLAVLFLGVRALIAGMTIFQGNPLDIIRNVPLKTDANGRTNIMVFGTSGSAKDSMHPGANLTDTLMVLSVDQEKKDAYMLSLPRDLYVDYGAACLEGTAGKINSMYQCFSNDGQDEQAGAAALKTKVSEVTGLDMQYYAHVNWAVVVRAIDAVGGVTVDVEGNGNVPLGVEPGSVYDVNLGVRYGPGPQKMSGNEALLFARARGAEGGYGLDRGDYDRQANQQKVIKALKEKATSAGTLTNLGKVTGLIDALGDNLITDFQTKEIRTLMSLTRDIPSDKIVSIDLANEDANLISGEMLNGASIQQPTAGLYDYSAIQSYIKKKINSNEISKEDAHVALFNASGVDGYAAERSTKLTSLGFTITAVENAPSGTYDSIEVYDLTQESEKPKTRARLEGYYKTTAITTEPPFAVSADTDFIVIYGTTLPAN